MKKLGIIFITILFLIGPVAAESEPQYFAGCRVSGWDNFTGLEGALFQMTCGQRAGVGHVVNNKLVEFKDCPIGDEQMYFKDDNGKKIFIPFFCGHRKYSEYDVERTIVMQTTGCETMGYAREVSKSLKGSAYGLKCLTGYWVALVDKGKILQVQPCRNSWDTVYFKDANEKKVPLQICSTAVPFH